MVIHTPEILYCLLAYFVGAIPFGVLVSRSIAGKDVRNQGSGNIGATNVSRLMGKKWGVFVLILDAAKGFVMVFASGWIANGSLELANFAAIAVIVGHCFPIYLKFKGGKGVATALGIIASLSPLILGLCTATFVVVFLSSRRISPASLLAALALALFSFLFQTPMMPATAVFIALLVWFKHRENLVRIVKGEEPRFF